MPEMPSSSPRSVSDSGVVQTPSAQAPESVPGEIVQQAVAQIAHQSAESVDDLIAIILDPTARQYQKVAAAQSLHGRIPAGRVADLAPAAADEEGEASTVMLADSLLASGPVATQVLAEEARKRCSYFTAERFDFDTVVSNALEADATSIGLLTVMAASPWRSRESACDALDFVEQVLGRPAMLRSLGSASLADLMSTGEFPADRLWALKALDREGGDLVPALADSWPAVSWAAYKRLISRPGVEGELWNVVDRREPGYLFALAVLARRKAANVQDAWVRLGSPAVVAPAVIEGCTRRAILDEYVPIAEAGTDPRWIIEAALAGSFDTSRIQMSARPKTPEESKYAWDAHNALRDVGLEPDVPVECGRFEGSGGGSFFYVNTPTLMVRVSALVPRFTIWQKVGDQSWQEPGSEPSGAYRAALASLTGAGLLELAPDDGRLLVPGLNVYFFGRRSPLTVDDLIFYWQD